MRPTKALLAVLALASLTLRDASAEAPPQLRPNILLLVAEDLSPRIGSFGDPVAYTPNIDALAAAGVRYTRVFTTAGVCAPSRAALITGQHQISFGAQHMRTTTGPLGAYLAQPDPFVKAFPELLRANGYFTFTDGKLDYQFSGVTAGSGPFTIWNREAADYTAWREREHGQPFFGLINFLQTHESGVMRPHGEPHSESHAATQQMRRNADLVAPAVTDPASVPLPPYYPDLPTVRADVARHYDNIRRMDAQVGEILDALRQEGLWESTIVIWTSDHGDGLPRAKRELYDAGIHVPLVLHIPPAVREHLGDRPAPPGTADHRLISFVDVAPAILRFAGVELPDYLHGEPFPTANREYVLASRDRVDEVTDRQRALRDQRFKYIRSWYPDVPGGHPLSYRDNLDMVQAWRAAFEAGTLTAAQRRWFEPPGPEQLYDLGEDPHELDNVAHDPAYQEVLARMRQALEQTLARVGDTGELEEAELREQLLKDGELRVTTSPDWHVHEGRIRLTAERHASIGYRQQGEPRWHLYTKPFSPLQPRLEAKAVRYGWRESDVVSINLCQVVPAFFDDPACIATPGP